ncbi:EthD family reductase [Glaciihabitans sp. dw_435]|uniref:EthD family reductase n=1 Tax=Glaciihabitans sp. dw_435 TaxID=2720081 RepID=UPI001BD60437|nr:EthD family reductase [Glaciihabitans sp. dw_435]
MTTKITIIYDNPTDTDAFEKGFVDSKQLDLARALPGLQRLESSKVWPKEDGSPTPAHRLVDLYFPDYDTASAAVATPAAGELFPTIFGIATGGVRIVFADVEES